MSCISMHFMCNLSRISLEQYLVSEWCLHFSSAAEGHKPAAKSHSHPHNDVSIHVTFQIEKPQPNYSLSPQVCTRLDIDYKSELRKYVHAQATSTGYMQTPKLSLRGAYISWRPCVWISTLWVSEMWMVPRTLCGAIALSSNRHSRPEL